MLYGNSTFIGTISFFFSSINLSEAAVAIRHFYKIDIEEKLNTGQSLENQKPEDLQKYWSQVCVDFFLDAFLYLKRTHRIS